MLIAAEFERVFKHKIKGQTVRLADPNPTMSAQAVQNFYANTYPELVSAKLTGPEMANDAWEYTFETSLGTKG